MKTALVLKEGLLRGAASLYRMDPPYEGEVTDWLEMEGSQRGTDSHDEIFEGIGYTIVREQ